MSIVKLTKTYMSITSGSAPIICFLIEKRQSLHGAKMKSISTFSNKSAINQWYKQRNESLEKNNTTQNYLK